MAAIKVNVNAVSIPWVLINTLSECDIEFYNDGGIDRTVRFPAGGPDDIDQEFVVTAYKARMFCITGGALSQTYIYLASGGSGNDGNGGIEIHR